MTTPFDPFTKQHDAAPQNWADEDEEELEELANYSGTVLTEQQMRAKSFYDHEQAMRHMYETREAAARFQAAYSSRIHHIISHYLSGYGELAINDGKNIGPLYRPEALGRNGRTSLRNIVYTYQDEGTTYRDDETTEDMESSLGSLQTTDSWTTTTSDITSDVATLTDKVDIATGADDHSTKREADSNTGNFTDYVPIQNQEENSAPLSTSAKDPEERASTESSQPTIAHDQAGADRAYNKSLRDNDLKDKGSGESSLFTAIPEHTGAHTVYTESARDQEETSAVSLEMTMYRERLITQLTKNPGYEGPVPRRRSTLRGTFLDRLVSVVDRTRNVLDKAVEVMHRPMLPRYERSKPERTKRKGFRGFIRAKLLSAIIGTRTLFRTVLDWIRGQLEGPEYIVSQA
jgi:hypothetical protein